MAPGKQFHFLPLAVAEFLLREKVQYFCGVSKYFHCLNLRAADKLSQTCVNICFKLSSVIRKAWMRMADKAACEHSWNNSCYIDIRNKQNINPWSLVCFLWSVTGTAVENNGVDSSWGRSSQPLKMKQLKRKCIITVLLLICSTSTRGWLS